MKKFVKNSNEKTVVYELDGKYLLSFNRGKHFHKIVDYIDSPDDYTEVSCDKNESDFFDFIEYKKRQKAQRREAERVKYEKRKIFLKNLRAWRRGEIEAYIVTSGEGYAEECSIRRYEATELFFDETEAKEFFDKEKMATDCGAGMFWITYIETASIEDRLSITSEDDLIYAIQENAEIIDSCYYSPALPDDCLIATYCRKQLNTRGTLIGVEDRLDCRSSKTAYSDLAANYDKQFVTYQEAKSLYELVMDNDYETINSLYNITKDMAEREGLMDEYNEFNS